MIDHHPVLGPGGQVGDQVARRVLLQKRYRTLLNQLLLTAAEHPRQTDVDPSVLVVHPLIGPSHLHVLHCHHVFCGGSVLVLCWCWFLSGPVTSLQYVFSILWLRLGLRQVVDTTDTRLPLWFSEDWAQEMAAVLESSSLMLTACGRSRSSSSSSPPGPGTRQDGFMKLFLADFTA